MSDSVWMIVLILLDLEESYWVVAEEAVGEFQFLVD